MVAPPPPPYAWRAATRAPGRAPAPLLAREQRGRRLQRFWRQQWQRHQAPTSAGGAEAPAWVSEARGRWGTAAQRWRGRWASACGRGCQATRCSSHHQQKQGTRLCCRCPGVVETGGGLRCPCEHSSPRKECPQVEGGAPTYPSQQWCPLPWPSRRMPPQVHPQPPSLPLHRRRWATWGGGRLPLQRHWACAQPGAQPQATNRRCCRSHQRCQRTHRSLAAALVVG